MKDDQINLQNLRRPWRERSPMVQNGSIRLHLLRSWRSKPQKTAELEIKDNVFAFGDTCVVYRKFRKFEIGEADKTSILHIIRSDAIISDAIHSLI